MREPGGEGEAGEEPLTSFTFHDCDACRWEEVCHVGTALRILFVVFSESTGLP